MFNLLKFYTNFLTCYANEPGAGGADDNKEDPRITKLEADLSSMTNLVSTLAQGQTGLQSSIQQLTEALAKGKTSDDDDDDTPALIDDDDLETMPRKDLVNLIRTSNEKQMAKLLKPLMDKISATDGRLDEAITSVTVDKFQETHPDLMEWKGEIGKILQAGRAASVADAYTLARAESPEKVKTIDAKYGEKKPEPEKFKGSFAGFPDAKSTSGANKRMTSAEAAAAAWEEATAAMPGIEQFLTS